VIGWGEDVLADYPDVLEALSGLEDLGLPEGVGMPGVPVVEVYDDVVLYTFIGFIPGTDETGVLAPVTLAIILAGEDAADGCTAVLDQLGGGVGGGQPFLQQGRGDEGTYCLHAGVVHPAGAAGVERGGRACCGGHGLEALDVVLLPVYCSAALIAPLGVREEGLTLGEVVWAQGSQGGAGRAMAEGEIQAGMGRPPLAF